MSNILNYQSRETNPQRGARRFRTVMVWIWGLSLILAIVLIFHPLVEVASVQHAMGGGTLGTPFTPLPNRVEENQLASFYAPYAFGYFALFMLTQWLFLQPRGSLSISPSREKPLPIWSAIAAAFIGMLLCIGLLATLLELFDKWLPLTIQDGTDNEQHFGAIWISMALCWAAWTVFFYLYWRDLDHYTALSRIVRRLVAGTILELLFAAPAHAYIVRTRDYDCYCEYGTYTGVAFGVTAALWLFGPGTLLLFLREKNRRMNLIPFSQPSASPQPEKPV